MFLIHVILCDDLIVFESRTAAERPGPNCNPKVGTKCFGSSSKNKIRSFPKQK